VSRAIPVLLAALALAAPARAELDLTVRRAGDPETWIRPTLRLDGALFAASDAWAGNAREFAGGSVDGWGEFGATPGLEGQLALAGAGALRARASGVYTTTQFGLDAAGSNFDDRHAHRITLEDAYVGWKSGDLVPSLGQDAIDVSVGSQPYQLGSGFLFQDGGTDGGERGGYWLGLRKAFRRTAIAGPLLAEGVYLRPNDQPNSSTHLAGGNLEWSFGERATLGGGYWNVQDSDDERRDGLHVFDLRFDASPFEAGGLLPGLRLSGEAVHEKNGTRNDSWGAYLELGYEFESAPWTPSVSYRYAHFTGDDGEGRNRSFDPLFNGFSDWGTWYLGEIVGEYVASNRNAHVHTARVAARPTEAITANLLYFFFRLDEFPDRIEARPPSQPRAALIRDRNLAHEIDLGLDWELTEHLSLSAVAGVLVPEAGAEDFFGDDEIWSHFMLSMSASF
jgi:hypothetical protein